MYIWEVSTNLNFFFEQFQTHFITNSTYGCTIGFEQFLREHFYFHAAAYPLFIRFVVANPFKSYTGEIQVIQSKTIWKIETANAIFWMYLGGTAQKIFFLGIKLFCFSRQKAETFRFSLKFKFVKPHKLSTHLAFSDNCYFHLFLSVV